MSEEPWDADRIAAECAATAREKARPTTRRKRKGESPAIPISGEDKPDDPVFRDPETGRMLPGHPGLGGGRKRGDDDFKPEYVARVEKWASMGATNAEMATWLGCALSTFYRWRGEHPELAEAARIGKAPADNRTVRSLYERANGYTYVEQQAIKVRVDKDREEVQIVEVEKHMPPDGFSMGLWLTNRLPHEWQHKRTIEHQGSVAHVTREEAERALVEFYQSGAVIEGTAVEVQPQLEAPETEPAEPEDF